MSLARPFGLKFLRRKVIRRDNWTCQICGYVTPEIYRRFVFHNTTQEGDVIKEGGYDNPVPRERRMTADHIIPRSLGGPDSYANLRAACAKCNGERGNGVQPTKTRAMNALRTFPIQLTPLEQRMLEALRAPVITAVPWLMIEPHSLRAIRNHGQSLDELERRRGLAPDELLAVLEDRPWAKVELHVAMIEIQRRLDAYERERDQRSPDIEEARAILLEGRYPCES